MNEAGVLDTTFDSDGIVTQDGSAGGEDDVGNSFDFDTSGNLVVVGQGESVSNFGDMVVWKYTSGGILDTSFNTTGIFSHNGAAGGSGFDAANDVAIDHDGNYLVAGYSRNGEGNTDMTLWKLQPDGSFDTSFAQSGVAVFDVSEIHGGASNDSGQSIYIDGARNILVAGNGNQDMCIWRFEENGELDTNFNVDGFFSHDSAAGGFGIDRGAAVIEDIFERIYIGGSSENANGNYDATFWRMK
jgi:uncharacterized delta-60 repeat protein